MLVLNNVSLKKRIEEVNLRIEPRQCWHLLGNNGAGKSSLLNVMSGLLAPDTGSVEFNSHNINDISIAELALQRCFLQQLPIAEFDISLKDILYFYTQKTDFNDELEFAFSLQAIMHKPLRKLSGGQQQRFHLARCLLQVWDAIENGQALIILDEPSQHLDVKYQVRLMQLLGHITNKNNAVVISSHDVNQTHQYATHIAWIKSNKVLSFGEVSEQMNVAKMTETFEHSFDQLVDAKTNRAYFVSATSNFV